VAITKARSGSPVRGYYVTTINTGRVTQLSGAGFGVSRLGGLINAYVDGLTGGGSAATRLAAQPPDHETLKRFHAEDAERVKRHEEWKRDVKETAAADAASVKKGEELQKKIVEDTKKAEEKSKDAAKTVEVVKDPVTQAPHVVAKDNAPASDLDDPRKISQPKAEPKTSEKK